MREGESEGANSPDIANGGRGRGRESEGIEPYTMHTIFNWCVPVYTTILLWTTSATYQSCLFFSFLFLFFRSHHCSSSPLQVTILSFLFLPCPLRIRLSHIISPFRILSTHPFPLSPPPPPPSLPFPLSLSLSRSIVRPPARLFLVAGSKIVLFYFPWLPCPPIQFALVICDLRQFFLMYSTSAG